MGKFRFSNHTPAKVAKVAKGTVNKRYPAANNLLKSAKVEHLKQECSSTLATVSNTLADQNACKINSLSRISNISRDQSINPEKTTYQKKIDDLWSRADELADWIDNPGSAIPWQERAAKVPELQEMSLEIERLKFQLKGTFLLKKNPRKQNCAFLANAIGRND